jgi:hypothetical protein
LFLPVVSKRVKTKDFCFTFLPGSLRAWCWELPTEQLKLIAVPWLRRLVASLPPRRPGFFPRSFHVGFVVDKVALGQVFLPSTSVFPCQFHSTVAPLQGKIKKTDHLSSSSP